MIISLRRKILNFLADKKFSEILHGFAWAIVAKIIATGLGVVTTVIVARIYGADVLGVVAVVNSFMVLTAILTVFGTNISILRLIPEHLAKYSPASAFRVYRKTQMIVIVVSVFTGILLFCVADIIADKIFFKPHLSFYFALSSVFVVFSSLRFFNTQAVRAVKLIRVFALMNLLPQGTNLSILILLGLFLTNPNIPVYALLGGIAVTGIFGRIVMEFAFRKKIRPNDLIHPMPAKDILRLSLPMLMTSALAYIIAEAGVLMVGIFRTEAEVGYYVVAAKLSLLTSFVLQAVNTMSAPKFSGLFHTGKMDELFYVAKKSTKLIFWTTSPILLFLIFLGKPLIYRLFGPEFLPAYGAMVILIVGQFVNSISGSTGIFMNMTGSQTVFRNVLLIAAGINVGLNLLFIPEIGIYGASVSATVSNIFWNLYALIYIKNKYGKSIGYLPFWPSKDK